MTIIIICILISIREILSPWRFRGDKKTFTLVPIRKKKSHNSGKTNVMKEREMGNEVLVEGKKK